MQDLADKIEQAEGQLAHFGRGGGGTYIGQGAGTEKKKDESQVRLRLSRPFALSQMAGLLVSAPTCTGRPAERGCVRAAAQEDCQRLIEDWAGTFAGANAAGDEGRPVQSWAVHRRLQACRNGHVVSSSYRVRALVGRRPCCCLAKITRARGRALRVRVESPGPLTDGHCVCDVCGTSRCWSMACALLSVCAAVLEYGSMCVASASHRPLALNLALSHIPFARDATFKTQSLPRPS